MNKSLESIQDIVLRQEDEFERGKTKISKYVTHSIGETIAKTDAAINSTFLHGDTDSKGRKKAYANITNAAVNIWFRATDIDRSNIKVRPTPGNKLNALLATAVIQDWMRTSYFGQYLNNWGRVLARNGSAVTKFTRKGKELVVETVSWSKIICDPVDFYNNPVSEKLFLTEQELVERIETHKYDKDQVYAMLDAKQARETQDGQNKDDNSEFYEIYETHGKLSLEYLTGKEEDRYTYVYQMHVHTTVGSGKDIEKFDLYKGRERTFPYVLSHLLEEDGRTLAIGAAENLFQAQWMMNKSAKQINDQLDFASKQFYQTTDPQFLGTNAIDDLNTGHVFITSQGGQISQVNTQATEIASNLNNAQFWKGLGNELNGISEAMLGAAPKSGTAWRQTEAVLNENYSLFEVMTENKCLALEEMFRTHIIPWIKDTKLNTSDEIVAVLDSYDIEWIDTKYLNSVKTQLQIDALLKNDVKLDENGQLDFGIDAELEEVMQAVQENGNLRAFKPSMITDKQWKEQLKDLEWDLEIDITGESKNIQEVLTTVNTALQIMMNPGYMQNPDAQKLVSKALELSGTLSPLELSSLSSTIKPVQQTPTPVGQPVTLPANTQV